MNRRRFLTGPSLGGLSVLAGCSTFEESDEEYPDPVDPASVSDDADEIDFPPGVDEDGVGDIQALAAAHGTTLIEESFRSEGRTTWTAYDGDELVGWYEQTSTVAVMAGGNGLFQQTRSRGEEPTETALTSLPADEFDRWADDEKVLWREVTDEGVVFHRHEGERIGASEAGRGTVETHFSDAGFVGTDDEERVWLADRHGIELAVNDSEDFVSERVVGSVDERGVFDSISAEYRRETAGGDERLSVAIRYHSVGDVALDRPDWYEAALAETDG